MAEHRRVRALSVYHALAGIALIGTNAQNRAGFRRWPNCAGVGMPRTARGCGKGRLQTVTDVPFLVEASLAAVLCLVGVRTWAGKLVFSSWR